MKAHEDFLAQSFRTGTITVNATAARAFVTTGLEPLQGIQLISMITNTSNIYIGSTPTVTVDDGYPLVPSDSIYLRISELTSIYVVSDSDGQEVRFLYL